MPSRKPIVQIVLNNSYHNKLKALAELDDRSISNMGNKIIERYIDDYEKIYGEIQIKKNN